MSKVTKISIWFICCVAAGAFLAYVDGIDATAIRAGALVMMAVGLAALVAFAAYRQMNARRKNN